MMKRLRVWMIALFGVLGALAFFAANSDAKPETTTKIADGVWFREGDLKNLGHCNNIIIEMKDSLIVVDANFPSGARLAMANAKKVSSKPVKYVFDTHHHGDHAYGNALWTKAGAVTLAYVGVAEEMKRYEPKRWQEAAKERKDVGELNLSTAEPPKETFSKSPHVIEDSTRRVEFHFFGWAHTRGDGFVFLPKEKLVCTGDAVVNGPYNYTGDGNIKNWPNVVRGVQKLGAERVLPAHGPAGGKEILAGQLAFFEELLKTVGASVKQGKKLEDLVKKEGAKQVATIKLPDGVKNWVGNFFASQVENAYKELTTGKPSGDVK